MSVEMERRAGRRVPVNFYGLGCLLDEDGHAAGDVFTAEVVEAGCGGIRVDSRRPLKPGRSVHLICRLSEFRAVPVVASVVWSRPASLADGGGESVGLRFTSPREPGTGKLLAACGLREDAESNDVGRPTVVPPAARTTRWSGSDREPDSRPG